MANPGTTVAGITIAALLGVGALALQASNSAPDDRKSGIAASATPSPPPSGSAPAPPPSTAPPTAPPNSGTGRRVVYSVGQSMVWLVEVANDKEAVLRAYKVVPGSVPTPVGSYRVQNKTLGPQTGGDGLTIANTVVIGTSKGYTLGFSGTETPLEEIAAANAAASPSPSPSGTATRRPTGRPSSPAAKPTATRPKNAGVRETAADGKAMYQFVDVGTLVVVIA